MEAPETTSRSLQQDYKLHCIPTAGNIYLLFKWNTEGQPSVLFEYKNTCIYDGYDFQSVKKTPRGLPALGDSSLPKDPFPVINLGGER